MPDSYSPGVKSKLLNFRTQEEFGFLKVQLFQIHNIHSAPSRWFHYYTFKEHYIHFKVLKTIICIRSAFRKWYRTASIFSFPKKLLSECHWFTCPVFYLLVQFVVAGGTSRAQGFPVQTNSSVCAVRGAAWVKSELCCHSLSLKWVNRGVDVVLFILRTVACKKSVPEPDRSREFLLLSCTTQGCCCFGLFWGS